MKTLTIEKMHDDYNLYFHNMEIQIKKETGLPEIPSEKLSEAFTVAVFPTFSFSPAATITDEEFNEMCMTATSLSQKATVLKNKTVPYLQKYVTKRLDHSCSVIIKEIKANKAIAIGELHYLPSIDAGHLTVGFCIAISCIK